MTYLVRVGSVLMFGPIGRVAERFATTWEFTHVRFLTGMRSQMSFQVLQTRIRFRTSLKLPN